VFDCVTTNTCKQLQREKEDAESSWGGWFAKKPEPKLPDGRRKSGLGAAIAKNSKI